MRKLLPFLIPLILGACGGLPNAGKPPAFTLPAASREATAMAFDGLPRQVLREAPVVEASLWSRERGSLLGDRRAGTIGDILTVVIEIDDSASISNSSQRSRSGSESLGIPSLFGIPQRLDPLLPDGASLADAVAASSASSSKGDGSVSRNERLTLRIAATVVGIQPNGVLQIQGVQEVRVNFELRELIVTGFVRPEDISRQNEITYDKIAAARISYGGRGQITAVQQPRIGQRIAEKILPF